MIRRAAAYATAASIGSVVGTLVGTMFGVVLVTIVNETRKSNTTSVSDLPIVPWPQPSKVTEDGTA